jgi:hypothetical protein
MAAAEKYGRVQDMPAESLSQARDAGKAMHDAGTTHNQSPAQKYSAPAARNEMGRSLSQETPGRSL